jgi:hypothetical protein
VWALSFLNAFASFGAKSPRREGSLAALKLPRLDSNPCDFAGYRAPLLSLGETCTLRRTINQALRLGGSMLSARARSQAYGNENLDVVTGTEGPRWEAAFLRYGTVCKTMTIDGSRARVMPMLLRLGAVIRFLR